MVANITNRPNARLSKKQKDILERITIPFWDLMVAGSGGHKEITNLSGFNNLGKGYVDVIREIFTEIAKEMEKLELEP